MTNSLNALFKPKYTVNKFPNLITLHRVLQCLPGESQTALGYVKPVGRNPHPGVI